MRGNKSRNGKNDGCSANREYMVDDAHIPAAPATTTLTILIEDWWWVKRG